jgi:antitoxin (DNA-binding transcriptional repressor) of toxin-antitoxin stability system
MSTVPIEEAAARLRELIDSLKPGEEIVITRDRQPIAKLVGEQTAKVANRQIGIAKDKIVYMADDFDAPLDDFQDYTH